MDLLFLIDTINHFGINEFSLDDLHDEMGLHPALLEGGLDALLAADAIEEIDDDVYVSNMDAYFDIAAFLLEMTDNGYVVETPPAPAIHTTEDDELDKLLVAIGIPAASDAEKAEAAAAAAYWQGQYEADLAAAMEGVLPKVTSNW